jgi:hypothetical protein
MRLPVGWAAEEKTPGRGGGRCFGTEVPEIEHFPAKTVILTAPHNERSEVT